LLTDAALRSRYENQRVSRNAQTFRVDEQKKAAKPMMISSAAIVELYWITS
jgi:hypothetical protein